MKKTIVAFLSALGLTVMMPLAAFAHVVVTPNQATVAERVRFSISVPNERNVAVTSLKLTVPSGVTDLQPDVKGGWMIDITKNGDEVSAVTWTGTIPEGQRADFGFKAQTPGQAGELDWKATQTYADGVVVNWDQKPTSNENESDNATTGPYSITTVSNDLTSNDSAKDTSTSNQTTLTLVFSIVALVLSALALLWRRRK